MLMNIMAMGINKDVGDGGGADELSKMDNILCLLI